MTYTVGEMAKLLGLPASTLGNTAKGGDTIPPHTRHAYGVPPSPRRGFFYAFSKALATSFSSCRMGRC